MTLFEQMVQLICSGKCEIYFIYGHWAVSTAGKKKNCNISTTNYLRCRLFRCEITKTNWPNSAININETDVCVMKDHKDSICQWAWGNHTTSSYSPKKRIVVIQYDCTRRAPPVRNVMRESIYYLINPEEGVAPKGYACTRVLEASHDRTGNRKRSLTLQYKA